MADITKINLKGTLLTIKDQYAYHNGDLATVATSGSYNDLTNKPNIPAGVTVDSTITQNGTNPVQGSAIYSALAGKDDKQWVVVRYSVENDTISFVDVNDDSISHAEMRAMLNNRQKYVLLYDDDYSRMLHPNEVYEDNWIFIDTNYSSEIVLSIGWDTDHIYIDEGPLRQSISERLAELVIINSKVPITRKINNKQLSSDITLNASDVGALPASTTIPTKTSDLTNDSGFTSNAGTITGITMNGASKGTSGVVDLGTVITAHQDISGKANASDVYTKTQTDTLLASKQDTLTFDTTPTANSTKPVTSGGIKTYVDGKATITGITTSQDGTFTISLSDGNSYTVNLNHVHPQYLKYELLADEAAYNALATKDSSTLYLIPES